MKVWLLEDGERTGPFESFSIRERISNGELGAETPAWFDGADGWVTLADVPSLVSAFPKAKEITPNFIDEVEIHQATQAPRYKHEIEVPEHLAQPPRLHPVQRLFARMIDVVLFVVLVNLVKILQGLNPLEFVSPTQQFLYHIPYVLLDGLLMHLFGTTPGKYLLGIKVTTQSGYRLSIRSSLIRSARVWVIGLGMFIITPISLVVAWFLSRRYGRFLWDVPQMFQVKVEPLKPIKVVIAIMLFFAVNFMYSMSIPKKFQPEGNLWEQIKESYYQHKSRE